MEFEAYTEEIWPIKEEMTLGVTNDTDIVLEVDGPALTTPISSSFKDQSTTDEADADTIIAIFGKDSKKPNPCCKYKCNHVIPKEFAVEHRYSFLELSKEEQDLVILSQLQTSRRVMQLQTNYGKRSKKKKTEMTEETSLVRRDTDYHFCALPICKKMYLFLHCIGVKRYSNLVHHFDKFGLSRRRHKLSNVVPKRDSVLTIANKKAVTDFITYYAQQYGSPVQGKLSLSETVNVVRLPSDQTKRAVYREYCNFVASSDGANKELKVIAFSTFTELWRKYCSNIIISKPSPFNKLSCSRKNNKIEKNKDS